MTRKDYLKKLHLDIKKASEMSDVAEVEELQEDLHRTETMTEKEFQLFNN